jgi:uncharacterized membrane protein
MSDFKRISIRTLGGNSVLAGSALGKIVFGKLIAALPTASSPEPVILDFAEVSVATGSFLRESIVALRDYCRSTQPNLYPVVANASEEIEEELDLLLTDRNEAYIVCRLNDRGRFSNAQLVGTLEEKQIITLSAVVERGSADANELHRSAKQSEPISITGWNNRLASLAGKGVLMEFKQGKSKVYKPVLEGIRYGR